MNETFINESRTIEELNEEEFIYRLPAFIILVLLMFFGVISNGLVIYVYGWRLRKSIVQYFIALLAIFDIGSCSIGVPLCLTVLRLPLLFPNEGLCKFTGFFIHFSTIASVLTLLVISIERYKRLCHPTKRLMSGNFIRYIAAIISLLAALTAIPCLIIYKRILVTFSDSDSLGYECLHDPEHKLKPYYWGFLFISVIIIIIIMLILYVLVWKRLQRYYLQVRNTYTSTDIKNSISSLSTSARRKLIRTTKITFTITFLFVASFLPLTIHQIIFIFHPRDQTSAKEKIYIHVLLNLWAFNSSLNPLVYGFYCLDFRRELRKIFQPWTPQQGSE